MNIDVLVAEIGSTTTKVNAFNDIHSGCPKFLGQGQAPTSVNDGDVNIGLKNAVNKLQQILGTHNLTWSEMLATSSAAGGLRMSVHGLVYDMTARAAKEAALGAGGIIKIVTAGKLKRTDIAKIKEISPNVILIAGGVDYGERDTGIYNFEVLAKACSNIPMIYAGNIQNQDEIRFTAAETGVHLYIADNVYPKVDMLNVEPTRKIIQDVFEEHIIHAPGMTSVRTMVNGPIMPTPGAVMESAKLLYEVLGDLAVFDVGGATTDLYSVTEGSNEINSILISPEPIAKRTVEGDLGVYVNIPHIVQKVGLEVLKKEFPDAERRIAKAIPIPQTSEGKRFIEYLTLAAVQTALERHAGKVTETYGPSGKQTVACGKDLTAVKYIIGTGGALTRLPKRMEILREIISKEKGNHLYPKRSTNILIDNLYIMASLGVLSTRYKEAATVLLKQSLAI
ncbi:GlmL-related ornithine degradation protein [Petroclostridium sp. X23]|uniref:GlmL-related ornithine degradation protein n=1 Tax=Petroclostridium sp. X23 TaxID=3045146 RepID=UPI0024AC842D|nr:GlmL-related ornithine degradation protein [Petroclostridium sp. X23]WHH61241.1 GlmL-related ornithine degradation protein [Petroclostridium sp. X23]